jgi:hypothetical protein
MAVVPAERTKLAMARTVAIKPLFTTIEFIPASVVVTGH